MNGEDSSAINSKKDTRDRNPYVIVSFLLGCLTGLYGILTGLRYYYAGWPAHGPVGVLGIFLIIFGLITILSSLLILKKRTRIIGAILILLFGTITSMQGTFNITDLTIKLVMPTLSFTLALYTTKQNHKP